jgi:hypothetical protein
MTTIFQVLISKKQISYHVGNFELPIIHFSNENILDYISVIEINLKLFKDMIVNQIMNNKYIFDEYSFNNTFKNLVSRTNYVHSKIPFPQTSKYITNDYNYIENKSEQLYIEDEPDNREEVLNKYYEYFQYGEKENKENIFKKANLNKDNINILLGLLDGIILRKDNILKGFLKTYHKQFDNEDLLTCIEHAILSNKSENVKILSQYLDKKDIYFEKNKNETIEYLKKFNKKFEIN